MNCTVFKHIGKLKKLMVVFLAGYTKWREWCGLSVPRSFEDLDDISDDAKERFRQLYQ